MLQRSLAPSNSDPLSCYSTNNGQFVQVQFVIFNYVYTEVMISQITFHFNNFIIF